MRFFKNSGFRVFKYSSQPIGSTTENSILASPSGIIRRRCSCSILALSSLSICIMSQIVAKYCYLVNLMIYVYKYESFLYGVVLREREIPEIL